LTYSLPRLSSSGMTRFVTARRQLA